MFSYGQITLGKEKERINSQRLEYVGFAVKDREKMMLYLPRIQLTFAHK